MSNPTESVLAMFLMSMTNFGDYYGAFEKTEHEFEAKVSSNDYVQLTIRFSLTHKEACVIFTPL
jgi:hypothetical protein